MSIKTQLVQEIEHAPEVLLTKVLEFLRFLRSPIPTRSTNQLYDQVVKEETTSFQQESGLLAVNERLVSEAIAIGEESQVERLVELALQEYVQRRKQLKIVELFGTIEYEEDYDYKAQRQV